jgi:hypothetical protein
MKRRGEAQMVALPLSGSVPWLVLLACPVVLVQALPVKPVLFVRHVRLGQVSLPPLTCWMEKQLAMVFVSLVVVAWLQVAEPVLLVQPLLLVTKRRP